MGKPGARKNDPIVSATPGDVHIIMVPSPGGPVPTPIPHPCASLIKDGLAEKVKVMGQPGAVKGSKSKHSPPHIPMGPGPFQKPPKNEGKIVTGSANVFYEGKEAAMLGDTGEMCSDPSNTPVGKVIGTAAMVLVGGGGAGSDEAREKASAAALAAAAAKCARFKDATHSGHPINVATGDLVVSGDDFGLDGPLPIQFVRSYSSSRVGTEGPMGWGWSNNLQESIELVAQGHPDWNQVHAQFEEQGDPAPDERYLVYSDPNGVTTAYHALGEIVDAARQRTLRRNGAAYEVSLRSGVTGRFSNVGAEASSFQLVEVVDRNDNRNRYRYDPHGRPVAIEDCYQRQLLLEYRDDKVASIAIRPSPHATPETWCRYHYDERGDLVEVVDRAGHSVRYAYADHFIVEDRNRDGYAFFFTFDALGRCAATWGQDGYLTRHFRYDSANKQTHEINGEGEQTVYHYTDAGIVWKTEKGAVFAVELSFDDQGRWVGRTSGGAPVLTVEYDGANNIAATTDGEGATHLIEYNAFGQATRMVDPLGVETRLAYDVRGNLIARTEPAGTTRYEHDGRGREVRRILPDGRAIETSYDEFGHVRERRSGRRIARLAFDALGYLMRSQLPGSAETSVEWTPEGYPARIVRNGRTVQQYAYTPGGDVREQLDVRGRRIVREFGAPGVMVREQVYGESRSAGELPIHDKRFRQDSEGRPRRIELDGRFASFEYDDAGRISREETSEGGVEEYRYNDSGLRCEIVEAAGSRFVEYNGRAQVSCVRDPDGAESAFEYDAVGRLVSAQNALTAVELEHDALGRVIRESLGDDEFTREDDPEAGRSTWSDGDGGRWTTSVAASGEIAKVELASASIELEYDESGRVLRKRFGNGLIEDVAYDGFARVTKTELHAGPATLQTRSIRYDGNRIREVEDSVLGDRRYEYDVRGRLVRVSGTSEEYYAWGPRDELLDCHRYRAVGPGDTGNALLRPSHEFDELGRVARIHRGPGETLELRYDSRNQLVSATLPDGGEVHYAYDPFGRRLAKRFVGGPRDGRLVRFGWRGEEMVRESHSLGDEPVAERRYLFFRRAPIACTEISADGERHWYYHTDHRGAPALISDQNGQIVWRSGSDSFGWSAESPAAPALLGLPGQYRDEETGLAYNRHRYYDAATNRYLQPDPIQGGLQTSPYSYPLDPISEIDRLGLMGTLIVTMDPLDSTNMRDEQLLATKHNARIVSWAALSEADLKGVDHVVINSHGTPNSVTARNSAGNQEEVGGAVVAAKLRDKGFKGNQVTVVSCETGQSGGTFAQGVADELGPGSEVTAWPNTVGISNQGQLMMEIPGSGGQPATWEPARDHARIFTARAGDKALS